MIKHIVIDRLLPEINIRYMMIILALLIPITFVPFWINQIHGTNDSIFIPEAGNEVRNINGDINSSEWKNASRINFPEASLDEQNEQALNATGIPNEIYIYEGVGHAFANPSGDNYAPEETSDAWEKTLAFLNRNL